MRRHPAPEMSPEDRIRELEAALSRALEVTEAERRRAAYAEEASRRAWRLGAWVARPARTSQTDAERE